MINLINLNPLNKYNYASNNGLSMPQEFENNKLLKDNQPYTPPPVRKDEVQSSDTYKHNFLSMDSKAVQMIDKKNDLVKQAELFLSQFEKAQEAYKDKEYKSQKLLEENIALKNKLKQMDSTNLAGYVEEGQESNDSHNGSGQIVTNTETRTEVTTETYKFGNRGKIKYSSDEDVYINQGIGVMQEGTSMDIDKTKNGLVVTVTTVDSTVTTDATIVEAPPAPSVPQQSPTEPPAEETNKTNLAENITAILSMQALSNPQFNGLLNMLTDYRASQGTLDFNNNLQEKLDLDLLTSKNLQTDFESKKEYAEKNKLEATNESELAQEDDKKAINQNMIRAYLDKIHLANL